MNLINVTPRKRRVSRNEKKPKRSVKEREKEQEERVSQCPECFLTFAVVPGMRECPHCGCELPRRARFIEEDDTAKLIKVEGFRLHYDGPECCSSYEELLEYAVTHGYKAGWAYYQARRRGMIA